MGHDYVYDLSDKFNSLLGAVEMTSPTLPKEDLEKVGRLKQFTSTVAARGELKVTLDFYDVVFLSSVITRLQAALEIAVRQRDDYLRGFFDQVSVDLQEHKTPLNAEISAALRGEK